MNIEAYTGWDIGGAHLKLASVSKTGRVDLALQLPMPLWQGIHILDQTLLEATRRLPQAASIHAITTTAELVDIFSDRHSGVMKVAQRICHLLGEESILFYAGRSGWADPDATGRYAHDIASANWHATAAYVAGLVNDGILLDIGSTTTDIIMFNNRQVRYHGYTDYERLSSHELVYTGVVRTPVMAITDKAPVAGIWQPVTAELFATMADVYRLTGELNEQDDMQNAPDGGGKSPVDSARRLARMFGADLGWHGSLESWLKVAEYLAGVQLDRINQSFQTVRSRLKNSSNGVLVGAGAGRFLARKLSLLHGLKYLDFADLLDTPAQMKNPATLAAAAVSVAQLARLQT
ncbi:MAG: hydantoinase/oxoprolinase family protein [Gammaproteobacteria bacterium]